MIFHVGQKVVCISSHSRVVKGVIYEIERVHEPFVTLVGVYAFSEFRGYFASRFRPLTERKTSIEIFEQIRRDVEKRITELV